MYSYSRASSRGTQPDELCRVDCSVKEKGESYKLRDAGSIFAASHVTFFQQGRNSGCSLMEES